MKKRDAYWMEEEVGPAIARVHRDNSAVREKANERGGHRAETVETGTAFFDSIWRSMTGANEAHSGMCRGRVPRKERQVHRQTCLVSILSN